MQVFLSLFVTGIFFVISPAMADLKIRHLNRPNVKAPVEMPQKISCTSKAAFTCTVSNCRRTVSKDFLEIDLAQNDNGLTVCQTVGNCQKYSLGVKTRETEWLFFTLDGTRSIRLPIGAKSFSESYAQGDSMIVRFGECVDITPKEAPEATGAAPAEQDN